MKIRTIKNAPKVSTGSMADIAFLLLIFFLVATSIIQDKGLTMQLPPNVPPKNVSIKERNLFKIQINSQNEFLIEGQVQTDLKSLSGDIKAFILNPYDDPALSENPKKAIISIKTHRGTRYEYFIHALDKVKTAYYQIYAERAGITPDEFHKLNRANPRQKKIYTAAREGIPMNISIAEPDKKR